LPVDHCIYWYLPSLCSTQFHFVSKFGFKVCVFFC
jgi:hypothetical protein